MNLLFPRYVPKKHCYFLVIFILNYIRFFNCSIYSISIFKYGAYVFDIFFAFHFIVCACRCNRSANSWLEKSVNAFYAVLFVALAVGYIGGQYMDFAIKGASRVFLLWGVYYYVKYNKIPPSYLLNILKFLVLGGMVVTVLCYMQFPNCWFGMSGEDAVEGLKSSLETRGVMRFNIPCKILVVLFIFRELQHFSMKRKQIMYLALLFVYLLMIGNRFPMAVCILMVTYMIVTSRNITFGNKVKIVLVVSLLAAAIFVIPATRNIVDKLVLMSTNNDANGVGDENIRVIAATYFFNEFNAPDDWFHILLGNGMCFPNSGAYADKMQYLHENFAFWQSDVGYCELYIYFGVVGLAVVALWFISAMTIKVHAQYSYIKVFILFIMISMICGGYWFEYMVEMAMLSYMLVMSNKDLNLQKRKVQV